MTTAELLRFIREHSLAVQASVSADGGAQAAVVGVVVTDDFEVFFDTVDTSRKVDNLRRNPRVAFVIGGTTDGDERTVQYEGTSDEPTGAELRRLKELYFESFPDGRERQTWPGITYIRARPTWIRYSDFNQDPPEIIEFDLAELRARTDCLSQPVLDQARQLPLTATEVPAEKRAVLREQTRSREIARAKRRTVRDQ